MKKLIVTLFLLCALLAACTALADGIDGMPAQMNDLIAQSSRWADWTVTDYVCPGNGATAFAALHKDQTNELLCFTQKNGQWQLSWHTNCSVPQGQAGLELADHSNTFYDGLSLKTAFSLKLAVPGEWESIYELDDGVWQLRGLMYVETDGVIITESYVFKARQVVYVGWRKNGEFKIDGVVQTNLRYFPYSSFQKDPDRLKSTMSNPPAIPAGTLTAREIQFTGGRRYNVYQGPDEGYGQAGNGKAAVSTNDWIQVFGEEDGWIMIQYDITSDHMRIGWIDAAALPANTTVPTLAWQAQSAWLSKAAALTDDPLFTQSAILTLPEGAWVTVLGTLGNWAYVESSTGDMVRGFIRQDALRYDRLFQLADHSGQKAAGTMTISPQGTMTIDMTVTAGDRPYAFLLRDGISGLDLGTTYRQQQGGYLLSLTLPGETSSISFIPVSEDGSQGEALFQIEW